MTSTRGPHTVTVRFQGPLDVPASVGQFRRWGDDLIDRWDGRVLVCTTRVGNEAIPFTCRVSGTVDEPALRVTVGHRRHTNAIEQVVTGMFVSAPGALDGLAAADPVIAQIEQRYLGVRPVLQLDVLTALVRSISAQQVNLKWAATTRRRLAQAFGREHTLGKHQVFSLEPERLAAASVAELRALQFTTRKAEYIISLAAAVADGELDIQTLRDLSDTEVIARLTALRGIGAWTADWFLARTLGRPRVAAGDLGLRKAIGAAYLKGRLPSETKVRKVTEHWGAAAGVAQQLVLHALNAEP
jgi:DNA-3-methyladenine glycosylase II